MDQKFDNLEDVTHMEEEAKYTIITMEDEEEATSQTTKVLTECKDAISRLYGEFRIWWQENQNSDEMKERKEWLRKENDRILSNARVQLRRLQENEDLRSAVNKGVKAASETGSWVIQMLSDGVYELRKSEGGQKVETMVHQIKEDERVKQGVASFKKGTLKLAESAFEGLKKVLDSEDTKTNGNEN